MEFFRSRAYAPVLTALALLATPHNADARGTKNLLVDQAVRLSCPNDYPVIVSGDRLEIAEHCRDGVLKIECEGARIIGASDVKPSPLMTKGEQTGISLLVSHLDDRTIEARCKKDKGRGRRIAISFEEVQPPPEEPAQVQQSSLAAKKATPAPVQIAKPAEPLPPKQEERGLFRSVGAGVDASLFSNGNNMVGSPGFFARGELGIFPNPKAVLDVEAGYVPLEQQVASNPPFYLPRNPGQKLEGGMVNITAGVSGKIWQVLHGGVGVGAGLIWIEEGRDVGVSRKPNEQGRRALANLPALLALHPLARAELEIAFDIRDDISLAFGGRGTWTLSALQTEAGERDNARVPLIDASAFAAAQCHFH